MYRRYLRNALIVNLNKRNYCNSNNIVYSKVQDLNVPSYLIQEYVWCNLDKFHDKTALVSLKIICIHHKMFE